MARTFRKTKNITLPLFKMAGNQPYYFQPTGPMFLGKTIDDQKDAATLLNVIDLETGEEGQIIVGAVLKSILNENYEGDSYVGKGLEIIQHKAGDTGKKYNTYTVAEVDIVDEADDGDRTGMEAEAALASATTKGGKKAAK